MAIRIRIAAPLRPLTGGRDEIQASGASVGEVLESLETLHPGFAANIFENGQIRRFFSFYLNGEDIRFLAGLHTPVSDGDVLSIIPAIAGARPST
jgi:MoaD family protein